MQIQPVSLLNYCPAQYKNNSIKKNNSSTNYQTDSFQSVSFKGFEKTVKEAVEKTFKTDKEVEKLFVRLMDEIISDTGVVKLNGFDEIQKVYKQGGFRGLLHELWSANPNPAIAKLRENAECNIIPLAKKGDNNIFDIFSFGRHGFWNTLFESKNATHDVKLTVRRPHSNELIEFGMDKKGNCTLCQSNKETAVYSSFHRETGNIKQ